MENKLEMENQKHTFLLLRCSRWTNIPIFLFLFTLFLLPTQSFASSLQDKNVNIQMSNASLSKVLDAIEKQSGYSFLVRNNDVDLNNLVSINVKNESVEEILNTLFTSKGLTYEIKGKRITIFRPQKRVEKTAAGSQQQRTVSGTVRDTKGESLIGVNVSVAGVSNGTVTDIDGNFILKNLPAKSKIKVSYIGYLTQEIELKDRSSLNIVLEENARKLDEVVVVGYGVQKKANLTGAVNSVKMADVLGERPVVSVSNALVGSMPGLQITGNSGRPGSEMSFNIRGANSINDAKPLVLVDNVEMDVNMLDPNDIESVSVLKDAASSAIYGARAAFGVILITTKKGQNNDKFTLNYSNNFSFSNPGNMPHKATPLQTVQAYKDMGTIAYQTGQNVDAWLEFLKEYQQNPAAYPDGYAMKDGLRYSLAETDLFKDMMETGFQQTHNISAGGGNKNISYRLALGTVSQDGVLISNKDSYKRTNISSYIRSDAYSWITPELDIKYANSKACLPQTAGGYGIWGSAVAFPSYFPLGNMELDGEELPINTPRNLINLSYPASTLKNDIRVFGKVTLKLLKHLNVIGEYTFNRKSEEFTVFDKKFSYAHGANFRKETSVSNSKYEYSEGNTNYKALNIYANYSNTWNKHELTLMGGFNQESNDYQYSKMSRTDMINENLPSISQATGDYLAEDDFRKYTIRGLFYRLNYSFAGKYLLETNGRYDGSSKFPQNSRFGFFPSISAGWRISEEHFMGWSSPFLSNLKLRASYGNIGNQSISPYAYIPGMESALANWLVNGQKVTTLMPPKLISSSFTWEKVNTIDVGIDMGLFNNRLNLIFDWYQRDTKGMLAPGMELPGVLGADAPLQNVANLRAKGWEVSVDWNDKIEDVKYYIGFNLYDSRNHITKYNNEAGLLGTYREGMEMGEIWGYNTDRLYTTNDFDAQGNLLSGIAKTEGYNPKPGDMLYKDLDSNGIINNGMNTAKNPGDTRVIGNNTRRYQYGIKGGASWKGFSLSFLLQGVGKRDLWIMNDLSYPFYDAWTTLYDSQLNYWTQETPNSYFPRLYEKSEGNTSANRKIQTRFLQDGSYLSIRNITIDYTILSKQFKSLGVKTASVFFSGENLYTFDHLSKGLDPETQVTSDLGQRGFTYPYMRQFSFGINLTF